MVANIMAMATAVLAAALLGTALVRADDVANNDTTTTLMVVKRPITTLVTTWYGTEVIIVSTTGSPVGTTTIAGPTPGYTGKTPSPIRGINKCELGDHGTWKQWRIITTDADIYNDPHKYCGSGYLANFRGECGIITAWGCGCTDGRPWPCQDIWMSFQTNMFCKPDQIRSAFHKATSGNIQMTC